MKHTIADLRDYGIPAVKRTANTIKRTGKTIDGKRMGTHNGYTGKDMREITLPVHLLWSSLMPEIEVAFPSAFPACIPRAFLVLENEK